MVEKLLNPLLLKAFLFRKLPLAWIAGLRVRHLDKDACSVSVRYGWLTKNPFRSMYFAAQSMAAEFTTALLGVQAIEASGKNIAMLIVKLDAEFVKKATSNVTFTCSNGNLYEKGIQSAIESGQGVQVTGRSEGRDKSGEVVSVFNVTWSFKVRS